MGNNPSRTTALVVGILIVAVSAIATLAVVTLVRLLRKISASVGVAPPTDAILKQENAAEKCALFRHFPQLVKTLAWRSLGAEDETPIHICQMPRQDDETQMFEFIIKREDLISAEYGGNKVRTLQHQLAVCEAKREAGNKAYKHLVTLGSGGSNQVLATVVHARKLGWDNAPDGNTITPCWGDSDEPDLDNTLNMLSVLSFPIQSTFDWGTKAGLVKTISCLRAAWTQTDFITMMIGGNCPVGVLGQAGGVLELAEQIEAGKCPDLERIYLPVGSACTVSGLIVGTVLVRHLGLKALSHPDFKIVGCNVDHGLAMMDRLMSMHVNKALKFMPMTVTHSVTVASRALKELGGPDIEEAALKFIQTSLDMRADKDVVGKYGTHSELTRKTSQWYDEKGTIIDYVSGATAQPLWMCGHFVSKAVQPLMNDLEAEAKKGTNASPKYMLWMTKSAVQPRGAEDEWSKFQGFNDTVQKWANDGKAESILRPGRVTTKGGKPEDYRAIMTQIS